jgi:hypothetical protein
MPDISPEDAAAAVNRRSSQFPGTIQNNQPIKHDLYKYPI